MEARAEAMGELEQAGTFGDLTQLGGGRMTSIVSSRSSATMAGSMRSWQRRRPSPPSR
ncbi:MAG TPA: hypothetical protein VGN29_12945 [Solirubrobacteraceae bacterium]|nr:hypothetical protein [Solirubrobacteraceae bacterium]